MESLDHRLQKILLDYQDVKETNEAANQNIASFYQRLDKKMEACDRTGEILEQATKEFNKSTSVLNRKDMSFLIFALLLLGAYKAVEKMMRDM